MLGMGIARDEEEALKWFSKSVRQGNSGAACFVGEFYIESDYAEAYKWLTILNAKLWSYIPQSKNGAGTPTNVGLKG